MGVTLEQLLAEKDIVDRLQGMIDGWKEEIGVDRIQINWNCLPIQNNVDCFSFTVYVMHGGRKQGIAFSRDFVRDSDYEKICRKVKDSIFKVSEHLKALPPIEGYTKKWEWEV